MVVESKHKILWYPYDYVFAVMDDHQEALKAVEDLRNAGFHAESVRLLHGEDTVDYIDAECRHCNLIQHIARVLWRVMTTEGVSLSEYEEEGKAGRDVLAVHTEREEEAHKAGAILRAHNARHIEYYEHGVTHKGL